MKNDLNIKNKLTSVKSIVCIVQQSSKILPPFRNNLLGFNQQVSILILDEISPLSLPAKALFGGFIHGPMGVSFR